MRCSVPRDSVKAAATGTMRWLCPTHPLVYALALPLQLTLFPGDRDPKCNRRLIVMQAVQAQRGMLGGWRSSPRSSRGSQSHCRSRVHVQAPWAMASTAPSCGDNSRAQAGYLSCTSAVRDDWALVKVSLLSICACCEWADSVCRSGRAIHLCRLRSRIRTTVDHTMPSPSPVVCVRKRLMHHSRGVGGFARRS